MSKSDSTPVSEPINLISALRGDYKQPRFYVQGESVRGEPRVYWVVDRRGSHYATEVTRDRRQAERWCAKMLAAEQDVKR